MPLLFYWPPTSKNIFVFSEQSPLTYIIAFNLILNIISHNRKYNFHFVYEDIKT